MLLFVEGELFVDGFEKGYDVTVVVPDEKLAQRGHSVVMPDGLAASVVFVGYAFIFEPTVERGLRCRTRPAVVERSRPISDHRPCTRTGSDLSAVYTHTLSGTCHNCSQALGSLPCRGT